MPTTEQVDMKVVDRLSTIGTGVDYDTISTTIATRVETLLLRDLGCCCNQLAE